jgi:hypothetical protein
MNILDNFPPKLPFLDEKPPQICPRELFSSKTKRLKIIRG